jgi:type II secretory pathway predicted ATPase ExeA
VSDVLISAFNLRRKPFGKDVAVDDLWVDDDRRDAVDRLIAAVTRWDSVLVKGEPGVGKNCVLRAMRGALSPVHFRPVYVANVTLGRRDFYRQVSLVLGIEPKGTPAALFEAIQRDVENLHREHRVHPVLVLDEAQLMPDSTLGHLHVLMNFAWDSEPLLSVVLVGLPELHDRLKLGIHRSLLTRLTTCIEVPPARAEQTAAYVRKRLADAGAKGELFAPDALTVLHELTGGLFRSVDVLAEASLRIAAQQDVRLVDRAIVRKALQLTPLA